MQWGSMKRPSLNIIKENIRWDDVGLSKTCICPKVQLVQKEMAWGRFMRTKGGQALLVASHEPEEGRILIRYSRIWQLADSKA